jgi:predicted dehydrogenase
MSDKKVSVLLVGISGYGHSYLKELFDISNESAYLEGVVDIHPTRSDYYEEIVNRDIPIYHSLEDFYQEKQADLAIISTPIHLHKEQSCYAMNHGSNVLCEKPMTANPEDIQKMIDVRDRTGKFLAIGFNWSFAPSTQQLKKDILSGKFGKAKRLKSLVLWPRNEDYYNRSAWAGKEYSPDGRMIFDSVVNNATAHFLHHLFYLTGDQIETSAELDHLTAELYKVNDIETFDTCAVNIKTKSDIDVLYIASHAVNENRRPHFVLEYENATITYHPDGGTNDMVALMNDGSKIIYKDPEMNRNAKLNVCAEAILNGHQEILCGIEAATPHVQSIYAMHQSVPNVPLFPKELTKRDETQKLNWIEGLEDILVECYENWSLPSSFGIDWSQKGQTIKVHD